MTTDEFEEFLDKEIMTDEDRKNIFSPPLEPQIALDILKDHFLGKDWYTPNPIGVKQVNTEVVYEILRRYPNKGRNKTDDISTKRIVGSMLFHTGTAIIIALMMLVMMVLMDTWFGIL